MKLENFGNSPTSANLNQKLKERNQMKLEKPVLLLGEEVKTLNTKVGVIDEILKFSNERKKLTIENYLERHADIIALAFDSTAEEVKAKVPFALLICKYFDCLEYAARVFGVLAEGDKPFGKGRGIKILKK